MSYRRYLSNMYPTGLSDHVGVIGHAQSSHSWLSQLVIAQTPPP